jgi:hypothetical protein
MRFCRGENDEAVIKWSAGERGIKRVPLIIDYIKEIEFLKEDVSPYLKQLWGILCAATHSHKKMMTSLAVPGGIWVKDKMMFEPFIVLREAYFFWWLKLK